MLRESIPVEQRANIDFDGLVDPNCKKIKGIENSEFFLAFVDAFMSRDSEQMTQAREALLEATGVDTVVSTAAIASGFQRYVRLADTTGIPSDDATAQRQADLVEQLGLDKYGSAQSTIERGKKLKEI